MSPIIAVGDVSKNDSQLLEQNSELKKSLFREFATNNVLVNQAKSIGKPAGGLLPKIAEEGSSASNTKLSAKMVELDSKMNTFVENSTKIESLLQSHAKPLSRAGS